MKEQARDSAQGRSRDRSPAPRSRKATERWVVVLGALILMFSVALAATSASAQDAGEPSSGLPNSADVIGAIEAGQSHAITLPPPDAEAAEGLPLKNLGRDEASELLTAVFDAQLQAPAGIFDDLEVVRFLAPDIAVIDTQGPTPVPAAQAEIAAGSSENEEGPGSSQSLTAKEKLRAHARSTDEDPDSGPPLTEPGRV